MSVDAIAVLIQRHGDWISARWIDRLALSRDASLYRMVPQAIARPTSSTQVVQLLQNCSNLGLHVTFRAAGTSLSGQAVTDGVLVDISRGWDRIEVLDQGARVRVQPGATGGRVNARLAPYGRKLGPDPASLNAAMIGGIVANNASGMCCGTSQNSYHTVESLVIILADGTRIDTASDRAEEDLARMRPDIVAGLQTMRDAIRQDNDLVRLIRRKYRIKNTMGYALNAFLDEESPVAILGKLMIGSEGTLGFIDEVVYRTVEHPRNQWTALFVYPSLHEACATIPHWRDCGAAAVELMDDASIRSFSNVPHTPQPYRLYHDDSSAGMAALLVEFHGSLPEIPPEGTGTATFRTPWFDDDRQRSALWKLRKGIMPTVGAMRAPGSTMINEDIAVPSEHLADLVTDLQEAFRTEQFHDAVIFGHAKDGNLHFIINQDLSIPEEVDRYQRLMDRIAQIVVDKYRGSLKAEHGTGRNMAAYVEREWGTVAYQWMWQLKRLLDPQGILNPDVILSADRTIHLQHVKPVPVVSDSINACIECGFCEHVCPTREITSTPRQRIVLERELMMDLPHDVRNEVEDDRRWYSIDSCAADGICSSACPVGINTGTFAKEQRGTTAHAMFRSVAERTARWPRLTDAAARLGATISSVVVDRFQERSIGARIGRPVTRYAEPDHATPDVILAPSCPSRWFGTGADGATQQEAIERLARTAGLRLHTLSDGSWCCGQLYDSKGLQQATTNCREASNQALLRLDYSPEIPVITDVSTCASAWALHGDHRTSSRRFLTPVEALETLFVPSLVVRRRYSHVVLHPGCGTVGVGQAERLRSVLMQFADRVTVPETASCCGMAGDHGLRNPTIVQAALRQEADDLHAIEMNSSVDAFVSLNPLCQSALAGRTQRAWISVWQFLDTATAETPGSSR